MYTITKQHLSHEGAEYDQYVLADTEAGTTVTVTPCKGGMITGMTLAGQEFSWLRDPNFYLPERPRCAVPVLFPCCGRCADGKNTFEGKEYAMDIHGMAHSLPWNVVAEDCTDGAALTVELTDSEATREFYPYAFSARITYRLKGSTVTLEQAYHNADSKPMPFAFGFHPYFACTDVRNLQWDLKAATQEDPDTGASIPAPAQVDFPYDPDQTTRYYKGVQSPMAFTDTGSGHKVTVSFDEHFGNVVLWSQCELGFVCMEPWNGWPNSLNTPDHEVLNPGETLNAQCAFTMELA